MQLSNSSASGNRRYFTLSVWLKRASLYSGSGTELFGILGGGDSGLTKFNGTSSTIQRIIFNDRFICGSNGKYSFDTSLSLEIQMDGCIW